MLALTLPIRGVAQEAPENGDPEREAERFESQL